jgi:hypothetical protein
MAPAYHSYELRGKLISEDQPTEELAFSIENSGNMQWFPDETVTEKYHISLPVEPKGSYQLAIQLFDPISENGVEIGLTDDVKEDGYFLIQHLSF